MKKPKFLRRNTTKYLRLGKKRKKLQRWRKPKGRHNKMRNKRKGYPATVSIGYGTPNKEMKKITAVNNLKELEKIKNNEEIIIGAVGRKKKLEIIKKAEERKIKIINLNVKKFMNKIESEKKETKTENKDKEKAKVKEEKAKP